MRNAIVLQQISPVGLSPRCATRGVSDFIWKALLPLMTPSNHGFDAPQWKTTQDCDHHSHGMGDRTPLPTRVALSLGAQLSMPRFSESCSSVSGRPLDFSWPPPCGMCCGVGSSESWIRREVAAHVCRDAGGTVTMTNVASRFSPRCLVGSRTRPGCWWKHVYPKLFGREGKTRPAADVGGKWSHETAHVLLHLAKAKLRHEPPVLKANALLVWLKRWRCILVCNAAHALRLSLAELGANGHQLVPECPE